ncbi:BglG family transcription antiterminator [Salipaludibacillus daqingensis]|uniref:BglG family transcription antiterminator n=1 Tax=Salipaludibacillus daqingensis TaxID=3041001 RepID=UPI002476682E|nr:BglG family transcription antiterminator [Salipaludibacillus daqingensis]
MLTIRQREMLNDLINNNHYISMTSFTDRYDLSLRSIRQDLISLEEWLLHSNIELDRHRKHGARLVLSDLEKKDLLERLESEPIFLSGSNRKRHMILMILQGDSDASSMEKKFDVSHNTMQNDISELKRFTASDYCLKLSRSKGKLQFFGEEINIRRLFIDTLLDLFEEEKLMNLFVTFKMEETEIELIWNRYFRFIDEKEIVQVIQGIETELNVEYTGSSLYHLFIVLVVQFSRMFYSHFLPPEWLNKKEKLLDTSEYEAIEKNLKAYVVKSLSCFLPKSEVAFSTLYFISAKKKYDSLKGDIKFLELAERLVFAFEKKGKVKLSNKPKIIEGLALHLKPAFHRMKYGLQIENALLDELKKDYEEYILIVEEIILAEFKGVFESIDEHEIGFLTIHLCSGIENRVSTPKKKVAIVCSSGIGTSSLLESSLRRKFPQASVHGVYSVNKVRSLTKENTDVILSTVSLMNVDVPWLKVSPFLNDFETSKIQELLGVSQMEEKNEVDVINTVKQVHELVKKHAVVENESKMFRELYHYFKGTTQPSKGNITSLSHPSCILLAQQRSSWEKVMVELNECLVQLNKTTPVYADELIDYITNQDHHFLIAEGIVFPHLSSDQVIESGFSMMTCDPPILFGPNEDRVWWVILLAAKNPHDHLPAVELLIDAVNKPTITNKLKIESQTSVIWEWLREREGGVE